MHPAPRIRPPPRGAFVMYGGILDILDEPGSMRHTELVPVVTAFLTHVGRVMLLKRSERVGTYRGSWAAVSGFIERLPLDQAKIEIEEEVGLSCSDVRLIGIGLPVVVDDPDLGRIWLVHPFLFETDVPEKVITDWETSEVCWINPNEISGFNTVPGLDRALASVWPAFGDAEFWERLSEIAVDTVHGATSLALSGLDALDSFLRRNPSAPRSRAIYAFAAARSSMGIFPHLAVRFMIDNPPVSELTSSLTSATSDSALHAAEGLQDYTSIITNSYSSAVKETLLHRYRMGGKLKVFVAESRPGLEGVTLARELAAEGINVTVITDAQVGIFAQRVDAVLVGCDAITEDDELQNKAGTSLIVLAANAAGVPCFGVTQTSKTIPPGFPHSLEEQDPDAVGCCEGVRFRNIIFDLTPLNQFQAVYTENGALNPDTLSAVRSGLSAAKF